MVEAVNGRVEKLPPLNRIVGEEAVVEAEAVEVRDRHISMAQWRH